MKNEKFIWNITKYYLPDIEDIERGYSEVVLVKTKQMANEVTAYYCAYDKQWYTYPNHIQIKVTEFMYIK